MLSRALFRAKREGFAIRRLSKAFRVGGGKTCKAGIGLLVTRKGKEFKLPTFVVEVRRRMRQ